MKTFILPGALCLTVASQVSAHESEVTRLTVPSSEDVANAKAVTDAFIKVLESGDAEGAIRQVAAGSRLFGEKTQQINVLVGRAKNANLIYGAIKKCVPSKYSFESSLRLEFHYICQYEELLLQWTLKVDNLPSGWTISNFSFSDSF